MLALKSSYNGTLLINSACEKASRKLQFLNDPLCSGNIFIRRKSTTSWSCIRLHKNCEKPNVLQIVTNNLHTCDNYYIECKTCIRCILVFVAGPSTMPTGGIIGAAVGSVVLLILIGVLIILIKRWVSAYSHCCCDHRDDNNICLVIFSPRTFACYVIGFVSTTSLSGKAVCKWKAWPYTRPMSYPATQHTNQNIYHFYTIIL